MCECVTYPDSQGTFIFYENKRECLFVCVWRSVCYFTTSTVVSRLVLCETWFGTHSRLIKRVCVLEADWESSNRLVCVCSTEWKWAKWSTAHTAFDKSLLWQACLPCVHATSQRSLLNYSLPSIKNNMSSQDISQSAHVSCCIYDISLSFLCLTASPFSQLPLPLFLFCLSLRLYNPPHSSMCSHLHMISHSESLMTVDDFGLLGVSAYFYPSRVLVPRGATFKNKTKPDPNLSANALDILVQYSSTG